MFVECNPDEVIVKSLTGLPTKSIIHDFRGKYEFCKRLRVRQNDIALIDEDPGKLQPTYLKELSLIQELIHLGLKVYFDNRRNNRIVLLCPELEGWIIRAAQDSGLKMSAYNLSDRSSTLHREINGKLDNLSSLLVDLTSANSARLNRLKELLN